MNRTHVRALLAAAGLAAVIGIGCKTAPPPAAPVLNSDGTTSPSGTAPTQAPPQKYAIRNQDGSVTNPDGSVTYPAGSQLAQKENRPHGSGSPVGAPVPATQPSSTSSSAPSLPPTSHTIPSGTAVLVRTTERLSASRTDVGSRFTGVLDAPLRVHGEAVFASGTPVSGEVVASKGKGRFKGAGDLGIELTAIGRDHVSTTEYEVYSKGRGKRTIGFAGGGAGLGALIGGLAGGGKGALIGGLAGAGAGSAAGAYTGSRDVVIPAESRITFRLTSPLTR